MQSLHIVSIINYHLMAPAQSCHGSTCYSCHLLAIRPVPLKPSSNTPCCSSACSILPSSYTAPCNNSIKTISLQKKPRLPFFKKTHQLYFRFISRWGTYDEFFCFWCVGKVPYNDGNTARFSDVAQENFLHQQWPLRDLNRELYDKPGCFLKIYFHDMRKSQAVLSSKITPLHKQPMVENIAYLQQEKTIRV